MKSFVLWVLVVFSISFSHADQTRNKILRARLLWSNMWTLANDIESLQENEILDAQLTKKLLEIVTWTRSSIFNSPNIHIRRVKRAAVDVLLRQRFPDSAQILVVSKSLDKSTFSPLLEGNLDTTDYSFIAELLVEWANKGDPTATEEMLRALESDSATKVFEVEFALSKKNSQDPDWLASSPEILTRIKRALGRPWVFELLRHYYEKDLRFSQNSENQFYTTHERPLGTQMSADELASHLTIENDSLFHFFLTLDSVNQKPSLLADRYESSLKIASAIEETLNTFPKLANNVYFASVVLQSIEVFSIHSPYIDQLVANWLETDFTFHTKVVQTPENYEKALVKEIRNNAFTHLLRVQQRFNFAQTRARASLLSDAQQKAIGLHYLPTLHPNSTALDEKALQTCLNTRYISNQRKLELVDAQTISDPFVQNIVLKMVLDPAVQLAAIERLNMATNLTPQQITELASIIGISSKQEADLYLARHANLRAQFAKLPTNGNVMSACRRGIRRWIGL